MGILACLAGAFEPYRANYSPSAYLDTVLTLETLPQRLASMQIFVAESANQQIVGTIACAKATGEEGHLRGMAVLPEWQGHGIAEDLLLAAEEALTMQGCTRITLDTTSPLQRAIQFYEKHGYLRSGRVTDFFGMPLYEFAKQF